MSDTQKNLYKKLLGRKGELIAQNFLKKQGYKIIANNYVTKFGEADIIAKKQSTGNTYSKYKVWEKVKIRVEKRDYM